MRNDIIITLFLMAIISFTACKKGQKQTELIHIPGIVENINLQNDIPKQVSLAGIMLPFEETIVQHRQKDMKQILFINASPNKKGNTAAMAHRMLSGRNYTTLNLIDYKIYPLGQSFNDDQFDEVINLMSEPEILVMGSPVYWHSMTGQFRTLLDRIYMSPSKKILAGKDLYFIFQGAAPSADMLKAGDYTMQTFCRLFGLHYKGMASTLSEAEKLGKKINGII